MKQRKQRQQPRDVLQASNAATKQDIKKSIFRRSWPGTVTLALGLFCLFWLFRLHSIRIEGLWKLPDNYFTPNPTTSKNQKRVQPWKVHGTPDPIGLFQVDDPIILQRHQCIARIRERQLYILRPFLEHQEKAINQKIVLVDPAYHDNVGDHMITLGEQELFRLLGWDIDRENNKQYQECHYVQANELVPHCEDVIWEQQRQQQEAQRGQQQNYIAVWHGGGNWGDLWRTVQTLRIQSFRPLLQNHFTTLVGMPQSLSYRRMELEQYDARVMEREIRVGTELANSTIRPNIILTWREYENYNKAQQLYPFVNNLLVPDIAFQLGPFKLTPTSGERKVDILFLLRRDHESLLVNLTKGVETDDDEYVMPSKDAIASLIREAVDTAMKQSAPSKSYRIVDWPDRHELSGKKDELFTNTSLQLLSMGRVLVCDRLHAAILAYLMGLPFVFLDQTTGKISKSLAVAFDSWEGCNGLANNGDNSTSLTSALYGRGDNLTDALQKAQELLRLSS